MPLSPEEALVHRAAIHDLMVRYATSVDGRDENLHRQCFLPDVVVEGMAADAINGIDDWIAFAFDQLNNRFGPTQHLLGNLAIHANDGETATVTTEVQATHALQGKPGVILILWATYEDRMVRTADGWRIAHHRLVPKLSKQF